MREILFRGKRSDTKEWIYGGFFYYKNNSMIQTETFFTNVEPETVGQFTGLYDKNGQRIFEHNIVKISGSKPIIALVRYNNGAFETVWSRNQDEFIDGILTLHDWIRNYEFEVIGNLFDNPNLLSFEYKESEKKKDIKIKIEFD